MEARQLGDGRDLIEGPSMHTITTRSEREFQGLIRLTPLTSYATLLHNFVARKVS